MPNFSSDEFFKRTVRVEQIVTAALALGVVSFLVVVLQIQGQAQPQPLLPMLAAGMAGIMIVVRLIVPGLMASAQRKQIAAGAWQPQRNDSPLNSPESTDADRLLCVHQSKTVIEGALLEGPAFFVLIAYIVSQETWLLGIVAILLAGLVANFPTSERCARWVEQQLEIIDFERR